MSQANVSDDKIIDVINKTNSHFDLSAKTVDRLERSGVSQKVINHMLQT